MVIQKLIDVHIKAEADKRTEMVEKRYEFIKNYFQTNYEHKLKALEQNEQDYEDKVTELEQKQDIMADELE